MAWLPAPHHPAQRRPGSASVARARVAKRADRAPEKRPALPTRPQRYARQRRKAAPGVGRPISPAPCSRKTRRIAQWHQDYADCRCHRVWAARVRPKAAAAGWLRPTRSHRAGAPPPPCRRDARCRRCAAIPWAGLHDKASAASQASRIMAPPPADAWVYRKTAAHRWADARKARRPRRGRNAGPVPGLCSWRG